MEPNHKTTKARDILPFILVPRLRQYSISKEGGGPCFCFIIKSNCVNPNEEDVWANILN